jgi:hypothetical protein
MAVPYTFSTATGSLPLSQLDSNFSTAITIGNTAVVLGDTITTINNLTLGNVAITSVSTAFPNGYLANSNVIVGTTTLTLGSTVTSINGLSLSNVTISSGNVTISNVTTTNVTATTANVTTANVGTLVVIGDATVGGNTTLGDASTDTVTVNGTVGIGGAALSNKAIQVQNTLSGSNPIGVDIRPVMTATGGTIIATFATGNSGSLTANTGSAVSAYGCYLTEPNVVVTTGSVTNAATVFINEGPTEGGTLNANLYTNAATGTNKYNIYASGTAQNYFAGNVGIGISPPVAALDVSGAPTGALSRFANTTAPTLSNDTHAGESIFLRSGGTAGSGNVQAVLAFGKADGSSLRTGSAIASVQNTADADQVGIGFYTSPGTGSTQTLTQQMLLDYAGNVGIGVTPSAWSTTLKPIEIGNIGTYISGRPSGNQLDIGVNNYYNAGYKYAAAASTAATLYEQTAGTHVWSYAIPGTAGNPISFIAGMTLDASGNLGIGPSSPTAVLMLKAGTATASTAPLKFTSGTNLTTPEAGAVEYDGTVFYGTTDTNFKRGTLPITNYTSGTGTALGTNTEATNAVLLPSANDTITLSVGTYFLDVSYIVTRGATSTTSATARINIRGSGAAVGNFSGMSLSAPTAGGATANFSFDAVNITTDNVLTAASTTAAGVYTISLRGILKITTSGTIIPQYSLSANINAAGTVAKVLYFRLQQLDTQSAAAAGPAGTGWA